MSSSLFLSTCSIKAIPGFQKSDFKRTKSLNRKSLEILISFPAIEKVINERRAIHSANLCRPDLTSAEYGQDVFCQILLMLNLANNRECLG